MTFRASCPHPSPTAPAPTSPDPRLLLDVLIFVILLLFQVLHDFIQYLRSFFLLRGVCPGRGGSEEGKKKSKNYNLEPPWEGLEVAGYPSRGRSSIHLLLLPRQVLDSKTSHLCFSSLAGSKQHPNR